MKGPKKIDPIRTKEMGRECQPVTGSFFTSTYLIAVESANSYFPPGGPHARLAVVQLGYTSGKFGIGIQKGLLMCYVCEQDSLFYVPNGFAH